MDNHDLLWMAVVVRRYYRWPVIYDPDAYSSYGKTKYFYNHKAKFEDVFLWIKSEFDKGLRPADRIFAYIVEISLRALDEAGHHPEKTIWHSGEMSGYFKLK